MKDKESDPLAQFAYQSPLSGKPHHKNEVIKVEKGRFDFICSLLRR